jgi:hypothetical protein
LKLGKATENPVNAKDESDLRHAVQPELEQAQIEEKKSGNPHFRGPSRFSKRLKMVGAVSDTNPRLIG